MYDLRKSRKWAADAPGYGIPFGARHISVHVELPNNFAVRHEPYRRFLQFSVGDQRQVLLDDFAHLVISQRPEWLIEIINSLAPKPSSSTDNLRQELQELLNKLRVHAQSPRLARAGTESADFGGARGAAPVQGKKHSESGSARPPTPIDLIFSPVGAKRSNISRNMERAPEIIPLTTEEEAAEKEISGKAARYFRETNQLFVNMTYSAVDEAQSDLERRYATYSDPELVRDQARQWAEKIIMGRVGYAVVFAQAKQLVHQWTPDDVKKALEPESLSLAADGWRDAIDTAYRSLSRRFGAPTKGEELACTEAREIVA